MSTLTVGAAAHRAPSVPAGPLVVEWRWSFIDGDVWTTALTTGDAVLS